MTAKSPGGAFRQSLGMLRGGPERIVPLPQEIPDRDDQRRDHLRDRDAPVCVAGDDVVESAEDQRAPDRAEDRDRIEPVEMGKPLLFAAMLEGPDPVPDEA